MDPSTLSSIFRDVHEELRQEGRALPVPPDTEDDELDREFWDRVEARLAAERPSR